MQAQNSIVEGCGNYTEEKYGMFRIRAEDGTKQRERDAAQQATE